MKKIFFSLFFLVFSLEVKSLEKCEWNNNEAKPCLVVTKTPNSSSFGEKNINKISITKKNISNSGALDINDLLKIVNGLDVFQSGEKGQQTSVFTRGSESNHTLVLLNGIAINDQSVTDGLHDFGQDFISTIQQIDVYKGSNGVHFGPNAIAGAINLITDIDYKNNYTLGGSNKNNFNLNYNTTKITDNNWHLNFKGSVNNNETKSAIANGKEKDGSRNYQVNLNGVKWLGKSMKLKSTLYGRKTKSDYDGSASDEMGYVADNKMYSIQSGLEHRTKNTESDLKIHYHKYDREYENSGFLDEYYSESLVLRGERNFEKNSLFSYGYGGEYKYDWGNFENRGSYNASTRGHMKNLGLFSNFGYKLNENQIFSFYLRADNHNTTDLNETYKVNFSQQIGNVNLNGSHSTGLRNPTLYELYGTDNYGIKGNASIDPEKSKTNEFTVDYDYNENISFKSTAYKTTIFDRIESNAAYSRHENMKTDIKQRGLENAISFKNEHHAFSLFNTFSKSRKDNGQAQNRRPDLSYGANYYAKIKNSPIGSFNVNMNYKHTGKYTDWDGINNSRQKSVDIINLSINKKIFGNSISFDIKNLLDKRYEKPATYSQDGRRISVNFKKTY